MKAITLLLALSLAACAGGRREAPLLNVQVSNNDRDDEQPSERLIEREIVRQPPRVVTRTRLVPTAPPRVCQCQ